MVSAHAVAVAVRDYRKGESMRRVGTRLGTYEYMAQLVCDPELDWLPCPMDFEQVCFDAKESGFIGDDS